MRPRGTPPTPIAASKLSEVVEMAGISDTSRSPSRIIDPLPNFFSMLAKAASTARPRSPVARSSAMAYISFFCSFTQGEQIITQCFMCATVKFSPEGEVLFSTLVRYIVIRVHFNMKQVRPDLLISKNFRFVQPDPAHPRNVPSLLRSPNQPPPRQRNDARPRPARRSRYQNQLRWATRKT